MKKKKFLSPEDKGGSLSYLLSSVIDEVLKYIFGESGAKVIYSFLENNFHLKREDFAEKPDAFSNGLKNLLGPGADLVLKTILKSLYFKLELKFNEKRGYEFSEYIKELRKRHS